MTQQDVSEGLTAPDPTQSEMAQNYQPATAPELQFPPVAAPPDMYAQQQPPQYYGQPPQQMPPPQQGLPPQPPPQQGLPPQQQQQGPPQPPPPQQQVPPQPQCHGAPPVEGKFDPPPYAPQAPMYQPQPQPYGGPQQRSPQGYYGAVNRTVTGDPLGPRQTWVNCPHCNTRALTDVEHSPGTLTWLSCLGLACVGCWLGCCLIPFCINDIKDAKHTCSNCGQCVGYFSPLH